MLYEKGIARRKLLLDTTLLLLGEHSLETISLHQISKAAGVPSSSAYHFFAGAQDVFIALAERFARELIEAITAPYSSEDTGSWQQLYGAAVDRAVDIYLRTPAYCSLILGPHSPPVIKLSDRENDMELGVLFGQVLQNHFKLPDIPSFSEKVFYSIEIVDLFLCLSYIYHQKLEQKMVKEAKLAAISYLEQYLPNTLPGRSPRPE